MAKRTTLSKNKLMTVLAHIARGASVAEASDKFTISKNTLTGIVSGKNRSEDTGLLPEKGKNGVEFIRANKEAFINGTGIVVGESVKAPAKSTKAEKKPSVTSTTPKAKTDVSVVTVAGVDVSEAKSAMVAQADTVLVSIETNISELKDRLEALYGQRDHWTGIKESFSAM